MANPERGELALEVEGVKYTLRPCFNACCELEGLINASFDQVMQQIQQGRLSGLRAVVWCLLWEQHREEIQTLEDASRWVERAGGPDAALDAVYKVFKLNLDAAIEASAVGRPPDAQGGDGTSASSSSVLAESA